MLYPRTKLILATFIGTVFQWLEYGSYGALVPIIAALFYPVSAPTAYHLGSSVAAVLSYCSLPLGAVLFGMIGDRLGRKRALSIAIFLMGISSILLGYLPTYSQIGLIAPLSLLCLRFLQSIALAGSVSGANIFLTEQYGRYRPNFIASWIPTAAGTGLLGGFLITQGFNTALLMSWGWRIPFFLSAISCIVATYLHFASKETPPFKRATYRSAPTQFPLSLVIKRHKSNFLKSISITAFIVIYLEICTVYYYYVLLAFLHVSHAMALGLVCFGTAMLLILMPIIGFVSDKVGSRSIVLMGLLGCSLSAPLLFVSAPSQSLFILSFVEGFFALFTASALAPLFRFQINLFPIHVRYTALSLSWALSLSLLSGLTIQLAKRMMHLTHWLALPAGLASISALLAFILILIIYPSSRYKNPSNHKLNTQATLLSS